MKKKLTTALIILDGYGYSKENYHNAIFAAETPTLDKLFQHNPNSLISGSGIDVGLPEGQMGNSEVGHMNLGAGRVIYQDLTRISQAITDKSFFTNSALLQAFNLAKQNTSAVHVLGMLSTGGVHSYQQHIHALVTMAKQQGIDKLYLHLFTDGRDTPPKSAKKYFADLEQHLQQENTGKIASISGRYYAMDRDNRWDRIQLVYDLLVSNKTKFSFATADAALAAAYMRNETDEFIQPSLITPVTIQDKDVILFMNFRADRAMQLTNALTAADFAGFNRERLPKIANFTTLTSYADNIKAEVAFKPETIKNSLGEIMQNNNKTQLRIAETEKYAHVTYFFNGGKEQTFENEDRILIASPQVATYDLQPEMSAVELTTKLIAAITSGNYDLIVCNYANCDMVGHTGKFAATVTAVETIDACIKKLEEALLATNSQAFITADHGNAEKMQDKNTNQPHTSHTCNPVPFIYIGEKKITLKNGILADIAPTILELMEINKPAEMTGKSLIS